MKMAYMYLRPKKPQMGVITLLHGKNFNGAYWEETANFLHEKGFGILVPDQIGFGKSSKPVDYQYTFEVLAHNTKRLLEFLKFNLPMSLDILWEECSAHDLPYYTQNLLGISS